MNNKQLPSLASFEDKRVTQGLKFILGGAVEQTAGGTNAPGGGDYVADAVSGNRKIYGLCKNHVDGEAFFVSKEYKDWLAGY
ncbi:hypothetical protein [Pedobacter sp. B4-66]|uniref:hypothetical protein n=1 Tax=Pedobacter sp. B4-66 TaxID=2817280 RepID=UPI001BDB0F2D|nr:hypothetical protein [Pedobacter sp. B4-66]